MADPRLLPPDPPSGESPSTAGPVGAAARPPRANVMLVATVERFGGASATRHRVRDLSPGGVRVDQAEALVVGATVLVSVGALEAVAATVRWAADGSAGLAFAVPIDPEQARMRAAVAPARATARRMARPVAVAPSVGWVFDLRNPYRG